ncbi:ninjurin-1-like isoform X2 [Anguilla rostrata]|uniref:ninjurin-1-like isoform X2 n=1 Tax=Anguilla rostrata TaxID=7938 RepID=UPI0030D10456
MGSLFRRTMHRTLAREVNDLSSDEEPLFQPSIAEDSQINVIRNINTYTRTKTLAQGFLDMALFTANASQMKYLVQQGPDTQFYYFLFVCLLIVAALLIYKASKNIEYDDPERRLSDRLHLLNNIVTGLILVITAVNIFITAFWFSSSSPSTVDPGLTDTAAATTRP